MAATRKIFWEDPYLHHLQTQVTAVRGDYVSLAQTIFFAFSGGQESDAGTIGGQPVLDAKVNALDIDYRLPPQHGLQAGQQVSVLIDGERRYCLMRLHFAAELALELMLRHLPGMARIGAHIAQDKARIDFEWPQSIATLLPSVEAEAQALIDSDQPILTGYTDELAQRRYWELAGFARVPCGGTHVRRTGELGQISLRRRNPGRGKERVEITLS